MNESMNHSMDHETSELLSAHHDGETTADERALVERVLEDSPEARRELDEVHELSDALASTAEKAPEGLRAAVLRRIERESLVGAAVEPGGDAVQSRSHRGHVAWLAGAAALASTAAVVLITAHLFDRPEGDFVADTEQQNAQRTDPAEHDDDRLVAVNERLTRDGLPKEYADEAFGRGRDRMAVQPPVDVPAPSSAFGGGPTHDFAEAAKDGLSLDDPSDASVAGPRFRAAAEETETDTRRGSTPGEAFAASEGRKLEFERNLARARVGDVVKALESREDGRVAVVRLTVVDRRAGLEALQVLLARNSVDQVGESRAKQLALEQPGDREGESIEKSAAFGAGSLGAGSLEAVFVETSSEQLTATLDAMRSHIAFRDLEVDEPIVLASLDDFESATLDADAKRVLSTRAARLQGRRDRDAPSPRGEAVVADKGENDASPANAKPADDTDPTDEFRRREIAEREEADRAKGVDPKYDDAKDDAKKDLDRGTVAEAAPAIANEPAPPGAPNPVEAARSRPPAPPATDGGTGRPVAVVSRQMNLRVPVELGVARKTQAQGAEVKNAEDANVREPARRFARTEPGEPLAEEPSRGSNLDRFSPGGGMASRASIPPLPRERYRQPGTVRVLFVLVTGESDATESETESATEEG